SAAASVTAPGAPPPSSCARLPAPPSPPAGPEASSLRPSGGLPPALRPFPSTLPFFRRLPPWGPLPFPLLSPVRLPPVPRLASFRSAARMRRRFPCDPSNPSRTGHPLSRFRLITDLLLQLVDSVDQGGRVGRTSGDVHVHRNDLIHAFDHGVRLHIGSPRRRAGTHRHHPFGLRHLVVQTAKNRPHLLGHGTGHDHHVGLPGGSAEDHAEAVKVVMGTPRAHHLDGAAGQTELQRPQGTAPGPRLDLLQRGQKDVPLQLLLLLKGEFFQIHFHSNTFFFHA